MKVIDFMPHWKDEEKCFEDAGFITDVNTGRNTGRTWGGEKPMTQPNYERCLENLECPRKTVSDAIEEQLNLVFRLGSDDKAFFAIFVLKIFNH
jgi:hypothetical protein